MVRADFWLRLKIPRDESSRQAQSPDSSSDGVDSRQALSPVHGITFLLEELMSDAMTFAELNGQHVELLPSRTVLSVMSMVADANGTGGAGGTSSGATTGGAGGNATGGTGMISFPINVGAGHQANSAGTARGGAGGSANGGNAFGGANGGTGSAATPVSISTISSTDGDSESDRSANDLMISEQYYWEGRPLWRPPSKSVHGKALAVADAVYLKSGGCHQYRVSLTCAGKCCGQRCRENAAAGGRNGTDRRVPGVRFPGAEVYRSPG